MRRRDVLEALQRRVVKALRLHEPLMSDQVAVDGVSDQSAESYGSSDACTHPAGYGGLQSYRVILYKVLQPDSSCFMPLHAAADPRLPQPAVCNADYVCVRATCWSAAFSVLLLMYRTPVCCRIARTLSVRRQGAAMPRLSSRTRQSCTTCAAQVR